MTDTAVVCAGNKRKAPEEGDAVNDAAGGVGVDWAEIESLMRGDDTKTGYEGQGDWVSDLTDQYPDMVALSKKWKGEGVETGEIERRIDLITENLRENMTMQNATALASILLEQMQETKKGVEETLSAEHGKAAYEAEKSITLGSQNLEQWKKMPRGPEEDAVVASLKAVIAEQRDVLRGVVGKYREEQKKLADKFESDFRANMAGHYVSQGKMPQKVKDGIERLKMSQAFELDAIYDEEVDEPLDEP
ncbi:hypothetical protein ACHAXT_012798 [Thalassiosira profunda]